MNKLPDSCYIGRIIPKDNFKNNRDEFVDKVERIRYMYLISNKTTNYQQNNERDAIIVLNISLKYETNITNIIKIIEKSINYNIIYQIEYNSQKKYGFYDTILFCTEYTATTSFDLLANSVEDLYESIKLQILDSLETDITSEEIVKSRLENQRLEKEIEKLEKLRKKENQMNKKNELRKEIKRLEKGINA